MKPIDKARADLDAAYTADRPWIKAAFVVLIGFCLMRAFMWLTGG